MRYRHRVVVRFFRGGNRLRRGGSHGILRCGRRRCGSADRCRTGPAKLLHLRFQLLNADFLGSQPVEQRLDLLLGHARRTSGILGAPTTRSFSTSSMSRSIWAKRMCAARRTKPCGPKAITGSRNALRLAAQPATIDPEDRRAFTALRHGELKTVGP